MAKVCTNCGSPIGDGEKFCTACGTPVQIQRVESNRYCTQCGNLLKPTAKFCEICGKPLPLYAGGKVCDTCRRKMRK